MKSALSECIAKLNEIATAGWAGFAMTIIQVAFSALILFSVLSFYPLFAQEKAVITLGDLTIQAWSLEKAEDRVVASGEVELSYKEIKLYCDHIEANTKTKDVLATGHVTLQFPEETISLEKITFNLDDTLGRLDKAVGRIQPSVYYEAAGIERRAGGLYRMEHGMFTSCTQPTPRWKFSFSKANFKKNDYVEMWNAVISIKKIPVFYWPYMWYPLGRQRTTGFLIPKIGYSKVKGFFLSESFYWAIGRNMDATFSLDYYGAKGAGGGLEYRYLLSGGTSGEIRLFYFMFKSLAGQTQPDNAYVIRWNHNQSLPGGFNLVAGVDYQNSFAFMREFDNNFQRALIFNRSSQVYISKSWASYNFSVRAARFETDFPTSNGSIIYSYLPQINFDSFKVKLFSPLYFSFSSSFNNWQYGWDYEYKAKTQFRTKELAFNPVLSLPFNSVPWLNMNFSLEGSLKYYWRSNKPGVGMVDEPLFTRNYAINVDLIGPVFYRIWELGGGGAGEGREIEKEEGSGGDWSEKAEEGEGGEGWGAEAGGGAGAKSSDGSSAGSSATRLKHVIEPTVSYRYESPITDEQKVISPYGLFRYHQLIYGLTNHLLLKKGDVPQEIFTWGINQTFYLSPEDSPQRDYPINGKIPRFSEIRSYFRFYPGAKYSFDFMSSYNTYFKSFSSIRLGATLGSTSDNLFLNINWYKSLNPYIKNILYDRHQVSLYGGAKIPALSLELRGQMDFNVTERKMLYSALSVVYHYQCLDLKADVLFLFYREKPETQFRVSFGLGNIGKTTDFLGGARFD